MAPAHGANRSFHEDYDHRGATQHPGPHLVTSSAITDSALNAGALPRGGKGAPKGNRRKKLEGMLRRERAKECYQLGLQLNADSPRAASELDDEERHKLKKKAIQVSKFDADKRDLLQVMESAEKREQRQSRPQSRGMRTARSALSGYSQVMHRYKSAIQRRSDQPEPLVWMHASEGAMHSKEVFREREREAGLRNDAPIRTNLAGESEGLAQDGIQRSKGCTMQQAMAMLRERLRSMLLQDKQAVRQMFNHFDKDGDGLLSAKEFTKCMHELGIPLTDHESNKFMQRFLDHSESHLDFNDFFQKILGLPHDFMHLPLHGGSAKRITKPEKPTEKQRMSIPEAEKWFLAQVRLQVLNVPHCLGRVFAVMDPDHSGTIDTDELREGLRKIGLWLKEDELRQLFQVYDEDQSGEIDYKEFIAEILGIPTMKNVKSGMAAMRAGSRPNTGRSTARSQTSQPVKGTIRARELQQIIRQKLERAIADPGHLREIFGRMDRDGSGVLTFDDFSLACEGFGIMLPADQKAHLFERFDTGRQGFLSYADFVNRVALVPHDIVDIPHPHAPEARCSTPQVLDEMRDRLKEGVLAQRSRIERLFKWFDKNNTKKISFGAFRDQIRALHLPLQDHHIKELWHRFGAPSKGHLDFRDFVEKMLDFNLSGPTLSGTQLSGTPEGSALPDGLPRASPLFDFGASQALPGEPKSRRSRPPSPMIKPFEGRGSATPMPRPGTAPTIARKGGAGTSGGASRKAPAPVDIFAQADTELRSMQSTGQVQRSRPDHSFRGDMSYRSRSARSQQSDTQNLRWESSKSIK